MHIYEPRDWDRIGWSPPREERPPLPGVAEKITTIAVYVSVGSAIVLGVLAAVL